ncbi:MAG: hypothetical protein QG597_321 [Actinomycetota bacterium]|nr:hypothetical protein [Actinomycetota bacterium]
MVKIAYIDDMPDADEAFIRAHRDELLELAAELGLTDLRVGETGRMVGTATPDAVPLAQYEFSARASSRLEHIVRMYSGRVTSNPKSSEDLRKAMPL